MLQNSSLLNIAFNSFVATALDLEFRRTPRPLNSLVPRVSVHVVSVEITLSCCSENKIVTNILHYMSVTRLQLLHK